MMQVKTHSIYDEIYELSPKSLHDICLVYIVKQISKLTTFRLIQDGTKYKKEMFFVQNIELPCKLAEKLLEELSKQGSIRNDTLGIFANPSLYNLKVVKLYEINMILAGQELLNYSLFRLKQLHLGCNTLLNCWSVTKLKSSFAQSCDTLTSLKVELYPAVNISSGTMFDFFVQFRNLSTLYYDTPIQGNNVTFTNTNWNMLFTACKQLKLLHCNINGSAKEVELDSSLFRGCANLRSIVLRSALKSEVALQSIDCVQHFAYMDNLRCIDFSIDSDPNDTNQPFQFHGTTQVEMLTHTDVLANYINTFLKLCVNKLQLLESLDLSGIFRLNDNDIQQFIECHPNLDFLGLCMISSKFCMSDVSSQQHMKISGCHLEDQIITSLLKYPERPTYMREVLKGLFQVSATWEKRRPFILKRVIDIMERFAGFQHIQLAATACIFHLSKEREGIENELNIVILSEIAKITTMILVNYIGNLQMVKNCLLIICTDKILHNAKFDRVAMSRLCLSCMLNYHEDVDGHVTRMAVAIVSILACKISSKETANLIKEKEMKLLLDIVQVRLDQQSIDSTLKFNLSALWNLTDESPQASKLFFELDGLSKYVRMLEIFVGHVQIETRILGLLNNIAEVKFLHKVLLLNEELINRVKQLVCSIHIPVSYFACGIIANLGLCWDDYITCLGAEQKSAILQELQNAVDRFGVLDQEIVTYRSFKPFYELLECHKREIQHWAVWAIHHVCTLGPSHYKQLMNEKCWELLDDVRLQTSSMVVREQIHGIYNALGKREPCEETIEM